MNSYMDDGGMGFTQGFSIESVTKPITDIFNKAFSSPVPAPGTTSSRTSAAPRKGIAGVSMPLLLGGAALVVLMLAKGRRR
jgi:hypothetical protein